MYGTVRASLANHAPTLFLPPLSSLSPLFGSDRRPPPPSLSLAFFPFPSPWAPLSLYPCLPLLPHARLLSLSVSLVQYALNRHDVGLYCTELISGRYDHWYRFS